MDYHARFYSSRLGRFISADSVIPNPMNPKGFDHYSYVGNNPIIYRDPTGHSYCDSKYKAEDVDCSYTAVDILREFYGVDFYNGNDGTWTKDQIFLAYLAVMDVGNKLASTIGGGISGSDAFRQVYNTDNRRLIFLKGNQSNQYYWDGSGYDADGNPNGCEISSGACTVGKTKAVNGDPVWLIKVVSMWRTPRFWGRNEIVHELGHLFNAALSGTPYADLSAAMSDPSLQRLSTTDFYGFASIGFPWQQSLIDVNNEWEIFADQFLGWVYNQWEILPNGSPSTSATHRSNYMKINMAEYLSAFR